MSSTVFAELTRQSPELEKPAKLLDEWRSSLHASRGKQFLLSWLLKDLSDELTQHEIAMLIGKISESDQFRVSYRILDPEGNLLSPVYKSVREIPEELCDLSGNNFKVKLSNVDQMIEVR